MKSLTLRCGLVTRDRCPVLLETTNNVVGLWYNSRINAHHNTLYDYTVLNLKFFLELIILVPYGSRVCSVLT